MCGIAGFLDRTRRRSAGDPETLVRAMGEALHHRGPDDGGVWLDPEAGLALAQRRLAIVDLSPAGHQPMVSADGNWVLVYNGEVFNQEQLRPELEARGVRFRGHSDTEVILESCAAFGVAATVRRLIGMFAFALWDRRGRTLTLVRDRLGIKPLYWGQQDGLVLFGSELKALTAHPGWQPEIDRDALTAFFRFSYIPAPHSIYRGIAKLPPGCLLELAEGAAPRLERFWDGRAVVAEAGRQRFEGWSDGEATDQLEALLRDAVRRRMIADVPLGAFLSGGVDSSTVVALMQAESTRPVRTFTIGFGDPAYDEAGHAQAVARHLGTDHTELYVTPAQVQAVIPRLGQWYDEPFADASQLPTYLVSALTRRHVTVALSGDGGDELFAGYNRHALADRLWPRLARLPLGLRRVAGAGLRALPPAWWDALGAALPARWRPRQLGEKLHKLAPLLGLAGESALYRALVSQWPEPGRLVPGGHEPQGLLWDPTLAAEVPELVERMQLLDLLTYLPDDILTKVDRASMAVALEARVPLLDHRVVEFAFRLPAHFKRRHGQGKWLLRQVLYRHLPPALIERPKMGFAVPLAEWLRGPLRDWAETLLDPGRLAQAGLIDPAPVRQLWQEHLSGRRNHQYQLWPVLMLELWRETNCGR